MGKCVSKQEPHSFGQYNENSNSYIAISEKSDDLSTTLDDDDEGQSESKKNAKRAAAAAAAAQSSGSNGTATETKGTAMSFGFKKKSHGFLSKSSKNKNQHPNDISVDDKQKLFSTATVITNPSILKNSDDNDNNIIEDTSGSIDSLNEHESSNIAQSGSGNNNNNNNINGGRTTPRLVPPKKDSSGLPYRPNRFGFRQSNVVRPASAGLTPKLADNDYVTNNQNNNSINYNNNLNVKRRSKSAGTTASQTRTVTPNSSYLNQHHQQQQNQQAELQQHLQSFTGDFPKIKSSLYHHNISQAQEQQQPQQQPHSHHKVKFSAEDNQYYDDDHQHRYQQHQPIYAVTQHINKTSGGNQYTVFKTDLHTNPIVKPTPQSVGVVDSVSKFTLHTTNLPKPQYPVPISLPPRNVMDTKVAKQALNSSRRQGFQGSREISSDSGIASYDSFGDRLENNTSPRRSLRNNRPRNLQMVMKGRNAFEVRDFDDSLSDESIVPLVLPKLPSAFNTSTQPAPLSGLIRTNQYDDYTSSNEMRKLSLASSDMESLEDDRNMDGEEEEKLSRDKSSSEKYNKNKNYGLNSNSSPGSSRASWEVPGETMATKDCSSLSISSSDESKHAQNNLTHDLVDEEDVSSVTITTGVILSSLTMTAPIQTSYTACEEIDLISKPATYMDASMSSSGYTLDLRQPADTVKPNQQEPTGVRNVMLTIKDKKFAEMVADTDNATLLDDETSPSDSLVSSCTDSDDMILKKNKKKVNDHIKGDKKEAKEIKDFLTEELECSIEDFENDNNLDISPVIDLTSPLSGPGSPTHASNSFSLSDAAGRDFLIDDEIADQPALVFDDGKNDDLGTTSLMLQSVTDNTPTLIDSSTNQRNNNNNNTMNMTSSRMGSLHTKSHTSRLMSGPSPLHSGAGSTNSSKPKNPIIKRTESLDTLSPCESIASDDLMMDFECHSSMDSIDRCIQSHNGSGSGSALHSMDETQLWSEIEAQGGDIAREWSTLLRGQKSPSKEIMTSQLPARATRLLNRSRLAQPPSVTGSDSPRSLDSGSRRAPLHKSHTYQVPEDMVLVDKSVRNSMLQDVVHLKKQLVRLRRLLQEDEDVLMRTETLNPFEHGQFFANCGLDLIKQTTALSSLEERDSGSLTPSLIDDPKQELADLRRQVVFLQGQIDDKDRTIRLQQTLILKLEEENDKNHVCTTETSSVNEIETVNMATQTERLRPLSMGQDGISRSEEKTQNNTKNQQQNIKNLSNSNLKKQLNSNHMNGGVTSIKTTLSSSTTALTSLLPSPTKTANPVKTVRTTQIGNVYPTKKLYEACNGNNSDTVTATTLQNNSKNLLKLNINGNGNCNSTQLSPSKKIPTLVRTQYTNYIINNNNNNNNKNNLINNKTNNNKIITNGNSSGNSSLNSSCSSLNSKPIDGKNLVKNLNSP